MSTYIYWFFFNPHIFLFKLAYLFNGALYSTAQNKSISMSMDPMNSTENWLDKGISLYPNYTVGADLLIYLCVPVWLRYKVSLLPCGCLCLDIILDYSFFDQTTHWIRKKKKNVPVHWCGATQPKDRLWLNLWMFYVSNEVFIIAWNISISKRKAEGPEPSNWSVEPRSVERQSEKQLHLSDTLKSDCIFCER